MNRTFALLSGSILSLLLLNSCETLGGGKSEGETIVYPTIQDVERIDRQMGLEPRQVKSRNRSFDVESAPISAPASAPAQSTAPALAPEPSAPAESAPPPQPSVDPATLQKLR